LPPALVSTNLRTPAPRPFNPSPRGAPGGAGRPTNGNRACPPVPPHILNREGGRKSLGITRLRSLSCPPSPFFFFSLVPPFPNPIETFDLSPESIGPLHPRKRPARASASCFLPALRARHPSPLGPPELSVPHGAPGALGPPRPHPISLSNP